MRRTEVLFYLFVLILWNCKVIYATLCGNINGASCCSGYYWDEIQKRCIPCKNGYFGLNCDTKCVYPSYGNDCQSKCNCEYTYCDHVEGCTNLTGENICKGQTGAKMCCYGFKWNKEKTTCIPCEKGYSGQNCEDMCNFPTYGLDCQSLCYCTETQCDPVDGCKGHSSKYAKMGLRVVGYQWNDTLGKYLRCKKGFTGFNCTTSCQFPTYGLDCQSICYCSNDTCHFVYGCMGPTIIENDSLYRLTSRSSLDDEMETNSQPSKMTIGTIVLATVAFSILLVILFTYRVEKRIRFMNHHSQYA